MKVEAGQIEKCKKTGTVWYDERTKTILKERSGYGRSKERTNLSRLHQCTFNLNRLAPNVNDKYSVMRLT